MSQIRAVVFDHYGTLVDIWTNEGKPEIFHYLSLYLQYFGAHTTRDKLRSSFEEERERYVKKTREPYPEVDLEIVFKKILQKHQLGNPFLTESCCKLYRLLSLERIKLFPDTLAVLKEIKRTGHPMALVSDAQKVFALDEIRFLGLTEFFPYLVLSTYVGFKKPDPRLFAIASSLLNIDPSEMVYIGDNPDKDIEGAKQTGMKTILVRRPRPRKPRAEADFYAGDLWEAWEWIRGYS